MRISDWSSDVCFSDLRDADAVIVGSYVPDGIAVGKMVQDNARGAVAFYDIDTPVTLAQLDKGECDYLSPERIPGYDYYFSFSGGPVPSIIEQTYGRSEEHTSELQSLMRISYPVFFLKKKKQL